jgi:hypothetical protein
VTQSQSDFRPSTAILGSPILPNQSPGLDLVGQVVVRSRQPSQHPYYAGRFRQYGRLAEVVPPDHYNVHGAGIPPPAVFDEVFKRRKVEQTRHGVVVSEEEKRVFQTPVGHEVHHQQSLEHQEPG